MEERKNPDVYVLTYRQEDLNWRKIVFLPFNFGWRLLMALFGCIYFAVNIYMEIFAAKSCLGMGMTLCNNMMAIITVCHFADTFLSLMHRMWGPVQKSMPYQPKSVGMLFVDILSIIPFQHFVRGNLLRDDKTLDYLLIVKLNGCLRVYRIFVELMCMHEKMWLNPILICVIQQNALIFSAVLVLSSVWYLIGILYENKPYSWLNDLILAHIKVNKEDPSQIYVFSFLHVFALMSNEMVADVRPLNSYEMWFIIFTIYLGAIMRYSFVMGSMIQSCLKCQGHMYKIKDFITINQKSVPKNLSKDILEYYDMFWNNWLGLHKCPLLETFPLCMQKDVLTDVYWKAIDHSHVLRHFPINIKRQLSLMMQSKFMQPGDHIFRKGEVRSTYYYIATGVAQIMSHYDGISPLMTISNGSCLGSRSLTLPTQCPTDVICGTECEVHFLTFKDFNRALSAYVNGAETAQNVEREHLADIKRIYLLSKAYKRNDPFMKLYGVVQDDNLKWIKQRWRTLSKLYYRVGMTEVHIKQIEEYYLPLKMTHTSKYLDSIVLSTEAKWAADRCCLNTSCPFIIDPDCNFIKLWLTWIVVVITIDCVLVPYCAAFLHETPLLMVAWDHIICFAYIFDIYLQMITAAKLVYKTISGPIPLLRYHLKSIKFLIEIVATIPVREVYRLFVNESNISPYVVLPRLLKIVRVFTYFNYKYKYITTTRCMAHVIKNIYVAFFIAYFAACFFFLLACSFENGELTCKAGSWYTHLLLQMTTSPEPTDSVIEYLFLSLYRVIKFIYSSGLNAAGFQTYSEIVYVCLLIFISHNVILFVYAELMAMWIMRRQRQLTCEDLIKSVEIVLSQKSIHPALIHMIESCLQIEWNHNYGLNLNLDSGTSEIVTPILRNEQYELIIKCIGRIEVFKELDVTIFTKLVKAFKIYRVPKGYIFCRSGEPPSSFNVIIKGACNLTSMLKEDTIDYPRGKLLKPGYSFNLMETLLSISCLHTTVSITECEIAAIDANILKRLFFSKLDNWGPLVTNCAIFREDQLDIISSKRKYRKENYVIPNFIPRRENKLKRQRKKENFYNYVFLHNYILNPPYIVHPNGKFMFVWETIKCIQVLVTLLYIPYMFNILCTNHYWKYFIALFFDMISMADVGLRFYVGNYNRKGVLVNQSGYYLCHSLGIDFLSSLPIYLILKYKQFHLRFYMTIIPKLLQIYRLYGYFLALRSRLRGQHLKLFLLVCLTYVLLICNVLSHCMYVGLCNSYCDGDKFHVTCVSGTWVYETIYYEDSDENRQPANLLYLFANFIVFIVLGNDQGGFSARTINEIKLILLFVVVVTIGRTYYVPKAVSYIIGHYQSFTRHRDNHRLFWAFINNEGGNKAIAQRIYNHFVFEYLKMKGIQMEKLVQTLHPSIQYDLTFAMYYKGMLCLHWFVGPSKTFMKQLCNKVVEMHYKREMTVINLNDINDCIYFIREGYVNILNKENELVRTIGPGSMFGSFKKIKSTRHQVNYKIKYNSHLLQIKSSEFMEELELHDQQMYRDFLQRLENKEYVNYVSEADTSEVLIWADFIKTGKLSQNSELYKWAMFFLSAIVPYLTVFPVFLAIALSKYSDDLQLSVFIYVLDVLSLMRIFFEFNSTYVDEMTGIYVTNLRKIRLQYVLTPSRFLLDVVTVLPLEVIGFVVTGKWLNILMLNRIGRLLIMGLYMWSFRERTYVRIWLRWFEYISFVTLPPVIFTCIWIYITCNSGCYKTLHVDFLEITDKFHILMVSMYEIVTLVTFSTSYELKKPSNIIECVLIVTLGIISFVTLPIIIGKFIQISIMSNYNQRLYEYNIYCMKIYLHLRNLSTYLLERLWNYSLVMYKTNNGYNIPPYVANAPRSMRCELFYDLYGGHIKFNLLFDECNHDLIYQLSGLLQRTVYFPGDFIIRKMDVDGRMYFINSGEVEEIEFDELNTENVKDVYITGYCFGLTQGLFERTPHFGNFKARTMVEILTLQYSDWSYLADYFPNDVGSIFKMARRLDLDLPDETVLS